MNRGPRKAREKSDLETVQEWVAWARRQHDLNPGAYGREMVEAVANVCSQVGTWKAKYEREVAKGELLHPDAGILWREVVMLRDMLQVVWVATAGACSYLNLEDERQRMAYDELQFAVREMLRVPPVQGPKQRREIDGRVVEIF